MLLLYSRHAANSPQDGERRPGAYAKDCSIGAKFSIAINTFHSVASRLASAPSTMTQITTHYTFTSGKHLLKRVDLS